MFYKLYISNNTKKNVLLQKHLEQQLKWFVYRMLSAHQWRSQDFNVYILYFFSILCEISGFE